LKISTGRFWMDVSDLIELQGCKVVDVSLDKHDIIIT